MTTRPAIPVEFRRSPGNGGRFDSTPPVAQAAVARDWLAAFHDTTFRRRFLGAAMLLLGVVAVSSGLLVVGELGYATVVGAGVGTYGLYLWMG
jgi:hypothetical protein